ncbi:hypothetical protein ACFT8V_03875 [Streptomyces griseoincarnatus]
MTHQTTDRAAVARVRALHQQYRFAGDDTQDYCAHCNQISGGWVPWPCPTVRALDGTAAPAAVSAAVAPPTQTALRDRIAEALRPWVFDSGHGAEEGAAADAVLAVLPEPTDTAALQRVHTVLETEAVVGRTALEYRELIRAALMADECPECGDTGACNGGPCPLRRMADETATDEAWDVPDARPGTTDHTLTRQSAVTTVPCSGTLSTPHQPHNWEPQPGMDPVHCPGTRKPAAGARQDGAAS